MLNHERNPQPHENEHATFARKVELPNDELMELSSNVTRLLDTLQYTCEADHVTKQYQLKGSPLNTITFIRDSADELSAVAKIFKDEWTPEADGWHQSKGDQPTIPHGSFINRVQDTLQENQSLPDNLLDKPHTDKSYLHEMQDFLEQNNFLTSEKRTYLTSIAFIDGMPGSDYIGESFVRLETVQDYKNQGKATLLEVATPFDTSDDMGHFRAQKKIQFVHTDKEGGAVRLVAEGRDPRLATYVKNPDFQHDGSRDFQLLDELYKGLEVIAHDKTLPNAA